MENEIAMRDSRRICEAVQQLLHLIAEILPEKAEFCGDLHKQLDREFPPLPARATEGAE